jgi:hypothetical protein
LGISAKRQERESFVFKVGVTAAVTVCVHKVFNSAGGFLRHLLFSVDEMVYGVRLNMAAAPYNVRCLMQECLKQGHMTPFYRRRFLWGVLTQTK